MFTSNFNLERKLAKQGFDFVIGVDEAGRGPLAGPVIAVAVILRCHPELVSRSKEIPNQVRNDKALWDLVRDSKKLSEKQREKVFDFIHENFYVGVGICDHKTIDRINILEASFLAMKKAIIALKRNMKYETWNMEQKNTKYNIQNTRSIVIVDGNKVIPNLSMEQMTVVGGDKIVKSISAASIIAKVTRDRLMLEMHKKYPEYRFDRHKGYGTKLHLDALQKNGSCKIHRQSFSPILSLAKKVK